jgi:hypothetical protein
MRCGLAGQRAGLAAFADNRAVWRGRSGARLGLCFVDFDVCKPIIKRQFS